MDTRVEIPWWAAVPWWDYPQYAQNVADRERVLAAIEVMRRHFGEGWWRAATTDGARHPIIAYMMGKGLMPLAFLTSVGLRSRLPPAQTRHPAAFGIHPGSTVRAYSYEYQSKRTTECTEMISSHPQFLTWTYNRAGCQDCTSRASASHRAGAAEHRDALRAAVVEHGALLIRGLGLNDPSEVEAVFRRLGRLMVEREAFTSRRSYFPGVYSASKWPPNQPMSMHHELSYALEFPSLMLFACLTAPNDRGATPVADSRSVLQALPRELVERFERVGWLLIRNYNGDIGASVAEAFGTDDRHRVESYSRLRQAEPHARIRRPRCGSWRRTFRKS